MFVHDYTLYFYSFSLLKCYYNYNSIWPYYIVIHTVEHHHRMRVSANSFLDHSLPIGPFTCLFTQVQAFPKRLFPQNGFQFFSFNSISHKLTTTVIIISHASTYQHYHWYTHWGLTYKAQYLLSSLKVIDIWQLRPLVKVHCWYEFSRLAF